MMKQDTNNPYFSVDPDPFYNALVSENASKIEASWIKLKQAFPINPYERISAIAINERDIILTHEDQARLIDLDSLQTTNLPKSPLWHYRITPVGKGTAKGSVRLMAIIRGGSYAFCTSKKWKWSPIKATSLVPPEAYPGATIRLKSGDLQVTWRSSGGGDSWAKIYTYKYKKNKWIPKNDPSIYSSDPIGPSCQLNREVTFHACGPKGVLYQNYQIQKIEPFVEGKAATRFSGGDQSVINTHLGDGVVFFVNKNAQRANSSYEYAAHSYHHQTGEIKELFTIRTWENGAIAQLSPKVFALVGGSRGKDRLTHLELFTPQGLLNTDAFPLPESMMQVHTHYVAPGRVLISAKDRLWLLKLNLK